SAKSPPPISTPQSLTNWRSPNRWMAAPSSKQNRYNDHCFPRWTKTGNNSPHMRFFVGTLIGTLILVSMLLGQATNAPSEQIRTVVGRLSLDRFKAHIKGLAQFGDRMQGSDGNRKAIDWLEQQLKAFGYTNVERQRYM